MSGTDLPQRTATEVGPPTRTDTLATSLEGNTGEITELVSRLEKVAVCLIGVLPGEEPSAEEVREEGAIPHLAYLINEQRPLIGRAVVLISELEKL